MFKGFEKVKDVHYIYTPFDSSLCGVKLEANSQKQYLLTGKLKSIKWSKSLCPNKAAKEEPGLSLDSKLTQVIFSWV